MSLVSLKVQKVLTQLIISNVIEPATEEHGTTVESETVFVIPGKGMIQHQAHFLFLLQSPNL